MGSCGQFPDHRAPDCAHIRPKMDTALRIVLLLVGVWGAGSAAAQTQTRCVRQDNRTVDCTTKETTPPLDAYAKALEAGQQLVPNYQDQERVREQITQLRLQNEMMRRRLEMQAAPGYDQKQCRRSAKAAIDAGDLILARDVLNACADER